jgi:hypothetical protein
VASPGVITGPRSEARSDGIEMLVEWEVEDRKPGPFVGQTDVGGRPAGALADQD